MRLTVGLTARPVPACLTLILALAVGSAQAAPAPSGPRTVIAPPRLVASQADGDPTLGFLGLAHVDVMDLHVERRPEGGFRDRELLPAADLADRFSRAAASGAEWNRWTMYWDMVERGDLGSFDWRVVDGMVTRDVSYGIRTLAILQGTPARYATGGVADVAAPGVGGGFLHLAGRIGGDTSIAASPPASLDSPAFLRAGGGFTDDPAQAERVNPDNPWARFVGEAVERYRPGGELARASGWPDGVGVRAWEIGNEPNLPHFWSGTSAQFARYVEVAYLVARFHDPLAIVMHGGIADSVGASGWFDAFLAALVGRAESSPLPERYGYYFDKTAWHWYVYPDLLHTGPDGVRALLANRGIAPKPIWATEIGVPVWSEHPGPCWDPTSPWRATTAEAAAYVWQALAEGVAAGVETVVLFQAYDDCGNGPTSYDAFGLIRNHRSNQCWVPPGHDCWTPDERAYGVPRPAFDAASTLARELAEAELLWRPSQGEPRWQRILFYRPPDTRVTVAWNWYRAGHTIDLAATDRRGTLFQLDEDGHVTESEVTPVSGMYSITLPGSTNRNNPGNEAPVMAGRPVVLVERDTVSPFRATIEALPEESIASFDLQVSAADGGTGVASIELFVADRDPGAGGAWRPLSGALPWTEPARGGRMAVPFRGRVGDSYWFAVVVTDRAGNVTALPAQAHARTRIVGGGGTASATAAGTPPPNSSPTASPTRAPHTPSADTPAPTPSESPTASPTRASHTPSEETPTSPPTSTRGTPTATLPTLTPAGPPWSSTIVLPVVHVYRTDGTA